MGKDQICTEVLQKTISYHDFLIRLYNKVITSLFWFFGIHSQPEKHVFICHNLTCICVKPPYATVTFNRGAGFQLVVPISYLLRESAWSIDHKPEASTQHLISAPGRCCKLSSLKALFHWLRLASFWVFSWAWQWWNVIPGLFRWGIYQVQGLFHSVKFFVCLFCFCFSHFFKFYGFLI